jgi:cytochrome P450
MKMPSASNDDERRGGRRRRSVNVEPAPHDDPLDAFDLSATIQSGPAFDPYPHLAAARRRNAVQPEWPLPVDPPLSHADAQVFNVLRHDEVVTALREHETYSSTIIAEAMGPLLGHTIVAMDEPEHRAHRALVAPAFRPKLLAAWEDVLVRRVVDEVIDSFATLGRADLVRSFTFAVPVRVIGRILGLPDQDATRFQRWSVEVVSIAMNVDRGVSAYHALRDYFAAQVELRRAQPEEDLISELVVAKIDGQRLTDEEIFAFLRLLLPAGIETTYRSLGSLLFALLTHPDQLEAVRRHPELRDAAIEEGLRWEPPFMLLPRVSTRDAELGGTEIPAGSPINLFVGSANRDERRFPDPDRFDVHRDPTPHVTFGAGPHACLGMHLARLESRVALDALLERFDDLHLDPQEPAPHIVGTTFRSPDALPVRFTS